MSDTIDGLPTMQEARIMVSMKGFIPPALLAGDLLSKYLWPVFEAYAEGLLKVTNEP